MIINKVLVAYLVTCLVAQPAYQHLVSFNYTPEFSYFFLNVHIKTNRILAVVNGQLVYISCPQKRGSTLGGSDSFMIFS